MSPRPALDRNTGAIAAAVFLMALGEELWKRFLPKYLQGLGAPLPAIGAYGSLRDLLDGLAQYPGGWVADRWGRRTALRLFTAVALAGYLILALSSSWQMAFGGMALAMAWASMASPSLFAVIGDLFPRGARVPGFTAQSILRRLPIAVAPLVGGLVIARLGLRHGVQAGLLITAVLALATFALVSTLSLSLAAAPPPSGLIGVWRSMSPPLRRLLLSDILIRFCEALVDVLLVLYALDVVGIGAAAYGGLVGIQMATSIVSYFPGAWLAGRFGQRPVVLLTFVAFAIFPLAVMAATSYGGLVLAFVIGGLRELGEPARKATIVDLAQPELRARSVGLYYLIRSLLITPAAALGGFAWHWSPSLPFALAGAVGWAGTLAFALSSPSSRKDPFT